MALPWSPRQIYAAAQTVTVGSETWTSAQDFNINNTPTYGSTWWIPPTPTPPPPSGIDAVGVTSVAHGDLYLSATNGGPLLPWGTTLTSGTAWFSQIKTAALAPLTVGPLHYNVPPPNATETHSLTLPLATNQSYLLTLYVTLQNSGTIPILFDGGTDLCRINLTGNVLACDVAPFPVFWPSLTADVQFTNFPAGALRESTACATMAFTTQNVPSPNAIINVSFTNRSGTMSWAAATGGNGMVTGSIVNVGQ